MQDLIQVGNMNFVDLAFGILEIDILAPLHYAMRIKQKNRRNFTYGPLENGSPWLYSPTDDRPRRRTGDISSIPDYSIVSLAARQLRLHHSTLLLRREHCRALLQRPYQDLDGVGLEVVCRAHLVQVLGKLLRGSLEVVGCKLGFDLFVRLAGLFLGRVGVGHRG
jgi:hypothetical protein